MKSHSRIVTDMLKNVDVTVPILDQDVNEEDNTVTGAHLGTALQADVNLRLNHVASSSICHARR
ncbi:MAG: hypothetical protein AAF327_15085 [Cyanobacteria bacterium P01_A01_bin.37]